MRVRRSYMVKTTTAENREFIFHTVADSEAKAEAAFRKQHPRWRRELTVVRTHPPTKAESREEAKARQKEAA